MHLSEKEKIIITGIYKQIANELNASIDNFSQELLVSYIELLLNYSNRFYARQFITRKAVSRDVLTRLEELLENYFDDLALHKGIPTVQFVAEQLHFSPDYLSDMLRSLTGQSAQQHIQNKPVEKAMELLGTADKTVAEVAYALGFEHPQSFHRFFRKKTNQSPVEYRSSLQ